MNLGAILRFIAVAVILGLLAAWAFGPALQRFAEGLVP